jgi:hypothetical protein
MAVDAFEPTLRMLTDGPRAAVLVVDIQPFGVRATLAECLAGASRGHRVYRIDPVSDLTAAGRPITLPEAAEIYAASAERSGRRPAIVASYCTAAGLAMHIAERMNATPVLVDPAWVDDGEVFRAIDAARAGFGLPPGSRTPDIRSVPSAVAPILAELESKLIADGIEAEERDELLPMLEQRLTAWFGFLYATRAADIPDPGRALIIASEGGGRGPAPGWTGVRSCYLPGEPETLLMQHRLAEMILDGGVLDRVPSAGETPARS